ncbi:MAG: general secretion pathway protein GspK [Desulfococcaceae bacterium]
MMNERGIALFIVLWVLALLSVIAGQFCHAMRTEINITRNFSEETRCYYIAKAGLNIALAELIRSRTRPGTQASEGTAFQTEGDKRLFPVRKTKGVSASGEKKKDDIDTESEVILWRVNTDIPPVPFADGNFTVHMGNESGKIDINRADERMLKMILGSFDMDEKTVEIIADSILDWRDADDLHRINGAENKYYQSLPNPYSAKNGNFDSPEELLLVKGMTPEIFYGGLSEMLTVHSDPAQGETNRININAASAKMLMALPGMTEELVTALAEYRKEKDFKAISQLIPILGDEVYAAVSPYLSVQLSDVYTIRSEGSVSDSSAREGVCAVVKIDPRLKERYTVMQWTDSLEYPLYAHTEAGK